MYTIRRIPDIGIHCRLIFSSNDPDPVVKYKGMVEESFRMIVVGGYFIPVSYHGYIDVGPQCELVNIPFKMSEPVNGILKIT
jgi:hypothetical protein